MDLARTDPYNPYFLLLLADGYLVYTSQRDVQTPRPVGAKVICLDHGLALEPEGFQRMQRFLLCSCLHEEDFNASYVLPHSKAKV
jgi:hypothetical protein